MWSFVRMAAKRRVVLVECATVIGRNQRGPTRGASQPSVCFLELLSDRRRSGQRLLCDKTGPSRTHPRVTAVSVEEAPSGLWGGFHLPRMRPRFAGQMMW